MLSLTLPRTESLSQRTRYSATVSLAVSKTSPWSAPERASRNALRAYSLVLPET